MPDTLKGFTAWLTDSSEESIIIFWKGLSIDDVTTAADFAILEKHH